jgi:hypothetical protein
MAGDPESILRANYELESFVSWWYLIVYGQAESTGSIGYLITPLLRCGPIPAIIRWATAIEKETMGAPPGSPICILGSEKPVRSLFACQDTPVVFARVAGTASRAANLR